MLNHILIPLDGSPLAEEALPYARMILNPGGRVTLVTAVDLSGLLAYDVYPMMGVRVENPDGQPIYGTEKLASQARSYAQEIARQLNGFDVRLVVEVGEPSDLIVKSAHDLKADAIVMSTHGRNGISRWLLGSVTQRVLSAAPCPVFVVPNSHRKPVEAQDKALSHA
ncbi:MAG: universal stress protein [bacterium]|nr:universal stress protein [bacterium]